MKRRMVKISVALPAVVTVVVERQSEDDEWLIASVRNVSCETSARQVGEHMTDHDFAAMDEAIAKAKDLP